MVDQGPVAVTRISKKGTSLRITLPKNISEALSVSEGQFVGFYLEDGKITLRKIK